MVSVPSDAEVISRSLDEPEAFGLVYDRHAAILLRFLGRRVGAGVAEGLVGELFRIAFERRKTFDASLGRGRAVLMAAIRQEVQPRRRPTVVPQLPYQDVGAALTFLERAFGFREIVSARLVSARGVVGHGIVEFGGSMIGIGTQGAHGAISPMSGGVESQYVSVSVDDVDAHYQHAVAAGARIATGLHTEPPVRAYEAFDPEGHRWRFVQWLREVPQSP